MSEPFRDRHKRAFFHSHLGFLRDYERQVSNCFLSGLAEGEKCGTVQRFRSRASLFVRFLEWDSDYFHVPVYRLEFAEWDERLDDPVEALARTLIEFKEELSGRHDSYYFFSEAPTEDITLLQAMGLARIRLVETRLTYFRDNLEAFDRQERSPVRMASAADIPSLRKVAMEARNLYDRYHADPFFPRSIADDYLATFAENSVLGFADVVMVPADGAPDPGGFFTAKLTRPEDSPVGLKLAHIVLVAVGAERRGWHLRLLSEMSHYFKQSGVRIASMTTQSTNRPVIRNCEKLGYRYGRCTHVFATHSEVQTL